MAQSTLLTTFVEAVEVRTPDSQPIVVWDMPVRLEKRDDLTALVFYTSSEPTTVTVLLSDGDRLDLIRILGGRKR